MYNVINYSLYSYIIMLLTNPVVEVHECTACNYITHNKTYHT